MSDSLVLRAVAAGVALTCGALVVMHMYIPISFEQAAQILLYGLYCTFVCHAFWTSLQRDTETWKRHSRLATFSTLLISFALSVVQVTFLIGDMLSSSEAAKAVVACSQKFIYVLANFVTGSFFLYRLYVIWEYKRPIIVFPIMLYHLLGNTCIMFNVSLSHARSSNASKQSGLLHTSFVQFLFYNLFSTSIVSLSIVRILQISRRIQAALGRDFSRSHATVTAMLLESGSAYPAAIAVYLIAWSAREYLPLEILSDQAAFGVLTQIAVITSTATLIHRAYGISIADVVSVVEVKNAVSNWSLSDLDFERAIDENSARRSASPEAKLLVMQTQTLVLNPVGDLEAGKAQM